MSRRAASASWSGAECAQSWSVGGGSVALLVGSSCRVVVSMCGSDLESCDFRNELEGLNSI